MNAPAPPHVDAFHVTAGERAVRDARDRLADDVAAWGVPLTRAAIGDMRLCASELITNALIHAGGECWVTVRWTGCRLRVAVIDRSPLLPVVGTAAESAGSGRGLALVEAFAHSWGWEPQLVGKAVHFLITTDATPADQPSAAPARVTTDYERMPT